MKGGTWLSFDESVEKKFDSIDAIGLCFDYMLTATQLKLDLILKARHLPILLILDKIILII